LSVFKHPSVVRDAVWNGSAYGVAKPWHDFTGLVPLGTGNDSCLLIVNHELRLAAKNPILGDGGGMTVFRVNRNPNTGRWGVVQSQSIFRFYAPVKVFGIVVFYKYLGCSAPF
jgi:secreted PhoX family phosphatase